MNQSINNYVTLVIKFQFFIQKKCIVYFYLIIKNQNRNYNYKAISYETLN